MPSIFERFFDHQIGYLYQTAASTIQQNESQIVTELTPLVGQGASALKGVVSQLFSGHGITGPIIEQILDDAIGDLDQEALALLSSGNVQGFVAEVVTKLEAHAQEMLAA
jgi:hypothetical protein